MLSFRNNIYTRSTKGVTSDIWLLALVMFINRSGAMVLPFLSIYLNQQLGISLTDCGLIMIFYGLGSLSGAFTGGILTDRFGFVPVMVTSLFLTGASFILVMGFTTFYALCGGIFLISFVADNFRPANLTAIESFSNKENLTRSIGVIRLAINLGYAFGPFAGGLIAASLGYNFLFIINALSVTLAGIVFTIYFRDKNQIPRKKVTKKVLSDVDMPWKDKSYMLYLSLFSIIAIVFFQLIYIVPLFYNTVYELDESWVGILMGVNGLSVFILELPLIYTLEKRYTPIMLVIIGGVLIAISSLAFILIPYVIVASLTYIIIGAIGEMLSFPFSNTYALSFCNNLNRGKYMGLYTMTFSLAHVIAPFAWFKCIDLLGYNMTWIFGCGMAIVACGLLYMIFGSQQMRNRNTSLS